MTVSVGVFCNSICDHNDKEPDKQHPVFQASELLIFCGSCELSLGNFSRSDVEESASREAPEYD